MTVTNATSGTWRYANGVSQVAVHPRVTWVPLDSNDDYDYWFEYTARGPGGETTVRHNVRVRYDRRVSHVRSTAECRSAAGVA